MKRLIILHFYCAVSIGNVQAQNKTEAVYHKGTNFISAGYGIGNIWRRLFVETTNFPGGRYKITSKGPFCLTYEHGFSDRISGGLILGYTGINRYFYYSTYTNSEKFSNFSALARANYHFGKLDKFDPYAGIGLGYYKFKYSSNDGSGNSAPLDPVNIPASFGYTVQAGAKYYFARSFAAFAEIGYLAGSFAQVGITVKF